LVSPSLATDPRATVAVIGGSGLYSLFAAEKSTTESVRTPYGTVDLTFGELDGTPVAFLPRHGAGHSVAPHLIGYRANIWALASVGVRAIISTAAVGAVHADYPIDSIALPDQYLDRTNSRADTFFDEGSVQHLPSAEPFCPKLHALAVAAAPEAAQAATVAVIQGPRFSTRAESHALAAAGAHLVNMTLYPEVPLAAELGIGTVMIAYITDNDAAPSDEPVTGELVFARLKAALPRIVDVISAIARSIPNDYAGRKFFPADEVNAVLARPVL
jgi:5'-methylthioadenosine phosphorylase